MSLLKQFITEKEEFFNEEYVNNGWWRTSDDNPFNLEANPERVKSFLSSTLKEFAALMKKEVEEKKKMAGTDIQDISPTGLSFNAAIDSILLLLDLTD